MGGGFQWQPAQRTNGPVILNKAPRYLFNIAADERRMNDPSRTHSFVHGEIGQKGRLW